MIVLSIGSDRKIFEAGSAARERMIEYGTLFTELHIIIFSLAEHNLKPEKISDNVWIYPTNSKNRFRYPFDARNVFLSELGAVKPDVITTQDPFESGLAGWLITRRSQTRLHMQIHTDFLSPYFARSSRLNFIRVRMASWLLPKADAIRAVSDRIRQSLSRIDRSLVAKTTVLPIHTDISVFTDAPITADLHKRYPQFSFIILMASRLTQEKNIGFAFAVLRDIVLKHQNVGLVIVGDGPDKRYLQGLALRYHLDRNAVFEPWQPSLASYYKTADVFLTTSLYEGYGLTLVEAAASGCPIVSSDVGIVSTIVEEGRNGFICDIKNKESFTEKIIAMIENPELKNSLKQTAERMAHEKVGEPRSEYLAKYKAMLESALVARR